MVMLERTLLVFFFAIAVISAASQPVSGLNRTDAQGRKQGEWTKSWPNGQLRYEGWFKDDLPVGEFRHYDSEGVLTTLQHHDGNGRTSRAEHFHPGGELMATGKYLGQEKDSTWNYYNANGALIKREHYRTGSLHGEQVTYYPEGQVAEREHYERGVRNGEHKSWFANGNPKSEAIYVNGEPEGLMTFWYPNGRKEIEGRMVNGNRDGNWMYYNMDGSLQLQVLYRNGVMVKEKKENGTFREYYDDEQVMSEVTYRKGLREGRFVEYHDNGKWVVRTVPADPVMGIPSDIERVLQGQTIKREGNYVNDLLDGEVKEYDERGKLLKVTRYTAGEVVGTR